MRKRCFIISNISHTLPIYRYHIKKVFFLFESGPDHIVCTENPSTVPYIFMKRDIPNGNQLFYRINDQRTRPPSFVKKSAFRIRCTFIISKVLPKTVWSIRSSISPCVVWNFFRIEPLGHSLNSHPT